MNLQEDIYIYFVDHFSSLNDQSLLELIRTTSTKEVSHHNKKMLDALNDVRNARSI
ncbi:hypothetical protein KMW28_25880 [Flammeovirga yaeyamensis]|uniref:Uncharacterized protein n=1 Tax=Flammeovirga yaeyamensis TaxID=367791 RepID=A0AAX1NDS6_9BACT|nr:MULTISPECIES: hypothetical protein [Flammeovirga]ANQ52063.1 hypothetical protein MY04_4728 [Flammeovirga sp. MY04]MBB3699270.1 hypothetical protein [Flammeovirga yaeyamensis]NMF35467.1 hypothetical protein [Flammeovirga yaeyamensis]QWG04327.1 hypothetical protein KMW28_25880 [Flammeovirga yaeyamensis]